MIVSPFLAIHPLRHVGGKAINPSSNVSGVTGEWPGRVNVRSNTPPCGIIKKT